jgi:hypothetical protein
MAVTCAKCGRQYDVTLFQFGRTISCACGARVGLEHRLNLPENAEIRFFADVNVASVVRWLRAVGIDTAWEDAIPDAVLIRRAIEEKRFVLTLDKRILTEFRADHVMLLSTDEPLAQFTEVVRHFNLPKPADFFTCGKVTKNFGSAPPAEKFTGKARTPAGCARRLKAFLPAALNREKPPTDAKNFPDYYFSV